MCAEYTQKKELVNFNLCHNLGTTPTDLYTFPVSFESLRFGTRVVYLLLKIDFTTVMFTYSWGFATEQIAQ